MTFVGIILYVVMGLITCMFCGIDDPEDTFVLIIVWPIILLVNIIVRTRDYIKRIW